MKVKLPRKIKKVYKSLYPEKSYSKIYSRMEYYSDSTLHKILDYVYCINNAYRGYKPVGQKLQIIGCLNKQIIIKTNSYDKRRIFTKCK